MCGFAAIIAFADNATELDRIERMGEELIHRGPDDDGIFTSRRGALAFRRLSILDLTADGHQPMLSKDEEFAMVFNGEIYNYIELRDELERQGWEFKSLGDAEVLLTAYQAWGEKCLQKISGMFSFVILNTVNGSAFVARDRAGIKPLFYARTDKAIFIASEPKAIAVATGAGLNEERLANYICSGRTDAMDTSDQSYFRGIFSVEASNALFIKTDGSIHRWQYWEPPKESADLAKIPDKILIEKYRELFFSAVDRQMRSDVPIGITLSGGIDSSSLACAAEKLIKKNQTEKITYFCFHSSAHDETRFRNEVLEQTSGQAIVVEGISKPVVDYNRQLIEIHDEPLHSPTALANAELYRVAREVGIKVLLGGQGADELLAGYVSYRDVILRQIARQQGWLPALRELTKPGWVTEGKIRQRALGITHQLNMRTLRNIGWLPVRSQSTIFENNYSKCGWLTAKTMHSASKAQASEKGFEQWDLWGALKDAYQRRPMSDYLRIEDRNSMAFGIEARVPFLDDDLVNFTFALPSRLKIHGGITKYIHRAAMRGVVPDELLDRPEKFGFPVNQNEIFSEKVIKECFEVIKNGPLQKLDLINFDTFYKEVTSSSPQERIASIFTLLQATLLAEHTTSISKRALVIEQTLLDPIPIGRAYYRFPFDPDSTEGIQLARVN